MTKPARKQQFFVELIRPSRYDDDGYVVQWWRSWISPNTLACLYGLATDSAARHVLGDDVEIVVNTYDESNTTISARRIVRRIRSKGAAGVICLVGVQSNQFPRALDLAREFRQAGLPVIIGGFHVSGSLRMLPQMPSELQEAQALGVSLFAGEAEGRMDALLADAYHGRLKAVYNYLDDLPDLRGQPVPLLPEKTIRRTICAVATFDTSRGCPFQCKFCTIINVQGRKPRSRSADDVRADRPRVPRSRPGPFLHHRRQLRPQQGLGADHRSTDRAAGTAGVPHQVRRADRRHGLPHPPLRREAEPRRLPLGLRRRGEREPGQPGQRRQAPEPHRRVPGHAAGLARRANRRTSGLHRGLPRRHPRVHRPRRSSRSRRSCPWTW